MAQVLDKGLAECVGPRMGCTVLLLLDTHAACGRVT